MQTRRGYLTVLAGGTAALPGCTGDSPASSTETPRPAREPYRLDAGEYETIVIFRNDDPAPGFKPEALRAVEEVFIDAGVPLTHGVVPASDEQVAPDSDFCGTLQSRASTFPDLFEFALHGYTHAVETEFYGASEFGGLAGDEQRRRITSGKELLTDCVEATPTTFIPPFNTYDDATVEALRGVDIPVVSGGWWFTDDYYQRTGPFETDGIVHVPVTHDVVKRYEPLELYDLATLQSFFDDVHGEGGGLFVPMIHYQHFDDEDPLETLRSFVEYVTGHDGVGFTTLGTFGTAYLDGKIERADGTWVYAP
jgi:hypothetical protein